ncbi:Tigger transposable element-derived protein 6 [Fusarium oxysporum f. sp. conglutinans]|nr:Tigger transposable element-derived protein 6 [Fusarium oxysporum f. sp. conglutinans]
MGLLRQFMIRHKPLQIAIVAIFFCILAGFLIRFQTCPFLSIPWKGTEVMALTKAPPLKPLAKPEGVIVSGFVFYGRKSRVSSMRCYLELWIDDNAIPNLVARKVGHAEDFVVSGNIINNPPLGFMHFRIGALHPYFPESEQPSHVTYGADYWKPSRHGFWDGQKNFTLDIEKPPPAWPQHRWLRVQDDAMIYQTPINKLAYEVWGSSYQAWSIAAQMHYSLLENIENNALDLYKFEKPWTMYGDRIRINFMCIYADDILDTHPEHWPKGRGDEDMIVLDLPKTLRRPVVVQGDALAAHFQYKHQGGLGDTSQPPIMSQPSNEARILLALQALQNNPKLRLRRAATIYKVGYSTLRDRRNGIQSRSDWVPKSRKLSDLEEQIIVQFLLDLDSRGFPARLRFVEEIANSLLADRDASPVGKRWAHNFVKRQPELKTRLFRRYDYQRAKCEDPTIIRGWFRLVQNTIAKYGIRSDDIWNFDETGFMMGLIMAGMAVTGSERQGRPKSVQPGNREWITVIQAINAEGQSIAPFIIGAGQYHLANWYRESNLPADWVIATSQNGWTNNELGLEWLKHFDRSTTKRSNARYRLLILDGHESHHSTDFEKYCKENKIITLCMPAHASHLLQPLDIGCFAVLKKAYGQEIEHLIRCSITHISKTEFFPAFYAAFKATFTESNIRGGFRGAGLAPLDPETVISKLDVQLRTPTPSGERLNLSLNTWKDESEDIKAAPQSQL